MTASHLNSSVALTSRYARKRHAPQRNPGRGAHKHERAASTGLSTAPADLTCYMLDLASDSISDTLSVPGRRASRTLPSTTPRGPQSRRGASGGPCAAAGALTCQTSWRRWCSRRWWCPCRATSRPRAAPAGGGPPQLRKVSHAPTSPPHARMPLSVCEADPNSCRPPRAAPSGARCPSPTSTHALTHPQLHVHMRGNHPSNHMGTWSEKAELLSSPDAFCFQKTGLCLE